MRRDQASPATMRTLAAIEQLLHEIRMTNWEKLAIGAEYDSATKTSALLEHGLALLNATLDIHDLIADAFLNHQIQMGPDTQPTLFGL